MKVSEIMKSNFIRGNPNMEIIQIAQILSQTADTEILVMDEKNHLMGIITQTDLLYKDIEPDLPLFVEFLGGVIYINHVKQYQEEYRRLLSTRAKEFMTNKVYTLSPEDSIEDAAKLMVEKKIAHLPVVDQHAVVGILRKSDIVKYVIEILTKNPMIT